MLISWSSDLKSTLQIYPCDLHYKTLGFVPFGSWFNGLDLIWRNALKKNASNNALWIAIGRSWFSLRDQIWTVITLLNRHVFDWSPVRHASTRSAHEMPPRGSNLAVIINLNPTCSDRDRWSASTWSTPTARSIARSDAPPRATLPER